MNQLFEAILGWNLLYTFPHSPWTSGDPGHILCLRMVQMQGNNPKLWAPCNISAGVMSANIILTQKLSIISNINVRVNTHFYYSSEVLQKHTEKKTYDSVTQRIWARTGNNNLPKGHACYLHIPHNFLDKPSPQLLVLKNVSRSRLITISLCHWSCHGVYQWSPVKRSIT